MPKATAHRWTKVVVRRLPPGLPEAGFREAVEKAWGEGLPGVKWTTYCPGKQSNKRTADSRAYLNFTEPTKVLEFKAKFHGHVFVSARGTQHRCSVEYAPFQKVPRNRSKKDPKEGTIERDKDYQKFIEDLEKPPERLPSAAVQLEREKAEKEAEKKEGGDTFVVTPLMEYIVNKHLNKGKRGSHPKAAPKSASSSDDEKKPSASSAAHKPRPSSSQSNHERTHASASPKRNKKESTAAEVTKPAKGSKFPAAAAAAATASAAAAAATASPPKGKGKEKGRPSDAGTKGDAAPPSQHTKRGSTPRGSRGPERSTTKSAEPLAEKAAKGPKEPGAKDTKVRHREGHQPYVPRVLKTRAGALERGTEASEEIDEDYNRNIAVNSTVDVEDRSRHRGRGRGRGHRRPDGRRGGGQAGDGHRGAHGHSHASGTWSSFSEDSVGDDVYGDQVGVGGTPRGRGRFGRKGGRGGGKRGGGGGERGGQGTGKAVWLPVKKEASG